MGKRNALDPIVKSPENQFSSGAEAMNALGCSMCVMGCKIVDYTMKKKSNVLMFVPSKTRHHPPCFAISIAFCQFALVISHISNDKVEIAFYYPTYAMT